MKTTLTRQKGHLLDVSLSSLLKALFVFILFSLSLNAVYANASSTEDNCVYGICQDSGEIGNEQTIVRGTKPTELIETKRPRCEPGELEYMWMYYSSSSGGWKHIVNSNSKSYQPGELFRTTYFLRCVRKKGCPTYKESNIVRVEVVDCMPSGIEHEEACLGDPIPFYAQTVYSTNAVKYKWTFEGGSPSSSSMQKVDVTWSSEGLKKVTLTVIDGQCVNTYEEEVYVINCDCKGFYCRVSSTDGCGSGSARANGYGGTEPYTYRWSTGASARRLTGLSSGNYSLTVSDANGCECVRYFKIKEANNLEVEASLEGLFCDDDGGTSSNQRENGCQARAIASVTGGGNCRVSISYSLNGGPSQFGSVADGLCLGDRVVFTAREDCTGCTVMSEEVMVPNELYVETETLVPLDCNGEGGQLKATVTGGTPPYDYTWRISNTENETGTIDTDGGMAVTSPGLSPYTFSFSVTDATGCTARVGAFFERENTFEVEIVERFKSCESESVPSGCNGIAEASVVTDTPCPDGYSYEWINQGETDSEIRTLCGDTEYCVLVRSLCNPDCSVFQCFTTSPTDNSCGASISCGVNAIPPTCGDPDQSVSFELTWNGDGNLASDFEYSFKPLDGGSILVGSFASGSGPYTSTLTGELGVTYQLTVSAVGASFTVTCTSTVDQCEEPSEEGPFRLQQNRPNPYKVFAQKTMIDGEVKEHYESNAPPPIAIDNNTITPVAKVFPNPFHESVNVMLGDPHSRSRLLNIQVMNVAGQVVQQQVIDSAFAKYELDLLNQPSGIYFIRISGEGIKPEVHKVVKR